MSIDTSGWWWMLPLGVGVVWAIDKIGGMGEEVAGLGLSHERHEEAVKDSVEAMNTFIDIARSALKKGDCGFANSVLSDFWHEAGYAQAHHVSREKESGPYYPPGLRNDKLSVVLRGYKKLCMR